MREGWRKAPIESVCQVLNGGTPKTKINEYWGGPHRWITPAEMGNRTSPYVDTTNRMLTDEGLDHSSAKLIPANSVILSTRAPIGHLIINSVPMAFNQGCRGLVPNSSIDCKFLYFFLSSNVELLNSLGTGTTFKELSATRLKSISIPLPPLPVQKRIVAVLDEAFAAIAATTANTERNQSNGRQLFESRLNVAISPRGDGWEERPLGDLVQFKHGFAFRSEHFADTGEHVLLTPGNFKETGGYRDRGDKQKYYTGPLPDGFVLEKGAFLVAMTEQAPGLLGSSMIVPEGNRFLHNQRLGLAIPKQNVPWCTRFFAHAFNTRTFRRRVHDDASGVKVRHTSPKKLCDVVLPVPTSPEAQEEVANELDHLNTQTHRLRDVCNRKLLLLAELKQSILHKAFTGELTADPKAVDRALLEAGV